MYVEKVELEDRRARLFGRGADIALLVERARRPGVTAVVGQPQMGKSWLLMETARRLAEEGWAGEAAAGRGLNLDGRLLVGFATQIGETPDMLPRAVQDLYLRWLSDAGYRQQASAVWERSKDGWAGRAAEAFGGLAKEVFKLTGPPGAVVGAAVEKMFAGLAKLAQEERTGGMQLPSLQLDDARQLLRIVCEVSGKAAVLFFDQWEKSPALGKETAILDALLRELDRWPICHVVLGVRNENKEAVREVERLEENFPDDCHCLKLATMELRGEEEGRLLQELRDKVAATEKVADEQLLAMIAGYPRVLNRWLRESNAREMRGFADLRKMADDANHFRYSEFERVLPTLTEDERTVAIRLAVLPGASEAAGWAALKTIILDGIKTTCLDGLLEKDFLESAEPPSYGHPKRAEEATACLKKKRLYAIRAEMEWMVPQLAGRVQSLEISTLPYTQGLAEMWTVARELTVSEPALALCEAARSVLGVKTEVSVFASLDASVFPGEGAALLAMGVYNTLNDAKQEEDLPRRDALLEQLRALVQSYPQDATVREQLAMGLNNTLVDAKQEEDLQGRDALLEELRGLAEAYPRDTAVRERLAMGLMNTMFDAKSEENLPRWDTLLKELRELAQIYPQDAAVREKLAKGLFITLNDARWEQNLPRREVVLQELRGLVQAYPEDAPVRMTLAKGLNNMLMYAKEEENLLRQHALLEELRGCSHAHPQDAAVRECLANGMLTTLNGAKQQNDLQERDGLMEELRRLAQAYPQEAVVRKNLAQGLINTLIDAEQEEDLRRRDALLKELRGLAQDYPHDEAVRKRLAMGLLCTTNSAIKEEDPPLLDAVLEELRGLAQTYPHDVAVREWFAKGLFNTLNFADQDEGRSWREALLEELRGLVRRFPEDEFLATVIVPRLDAPGD